MANYADGLLPLTQHALRFYGKIGYLDYCGLFETPEKRAQLPQALGGGDVLMLRNHGPVVMGSFAADHVIRKVDAFHAAVRAAVACAAEGKIVVAMFASSLYRMQILVV